jgi:RNA exonuclease 4
VALDCEFVECVDGEQVARISIVGENGEELFDSYIRPESRIIDYRTEFSGVTFGHLRKAPTWAAVLRDVHKVLYNRVLVGHTLYKDLEVMRMTGWKGIKSMVDVSRYSQYKEGGKVQALKKLTAVFLGRDIQIGKHSSLQDAKATMELFILRKDKILAEIERKDKFLQKKEAH